ncbi:hypothetical protein VP01_2404g8 [Puccinia sorghi]|uniref:Uncharacterized protein n=1 Tax=Puccinia sorghi TaxID=27349 RepID=A0A0L6V6U5_9BASI|nr:hypothetical protein VP01_2404g8 [Puccinia sorghi]
MRPEVFLEIEDRKVGFLEELVPMIEERWRKHCVDDASRMMVFVQSQAGVEQLGKALMVKNMPAAYYHAALVEEIGDEEIGKW